MLLSLEVLSLWVVSGGWLYDDAHSVCVVRRKWPLLLYRVSRESNAVILLSGDWSLGVIRDG